MPPTSESDTDSIRNCPKISGSVAPIDLRRPISYVRSLIEICITEKMPMPPTRSEIPAIEASTIFQLMTSLSISVRIAEDLLADVLDLEVGDPAVAAPQKRLGLRLGVLELLGDRPGGPRRAPCRSPTKYFWAVVIGM